MKNKKECPDIDDNLALESAVEAMNDTVGPGGLVTSLLDFGVHPGYVPGGLDSDLQNQRQKHEGIKFGSRRFHSNLELVANRICITE